MYGFEIGQIVYNKIVLNDEHDIIIPANTALKLIAFAPKVCISHYESEYCDKKAYFFNAVVADGDEFSPRIRANFCTISKRPVNN